ncbi:putative sterigmatocystin biosynthesis peroxidase stcC [Hypsizygus marmoreus]|uniref:Sterigmatocystin biosynthesis peroxidase stcC n=1 Tax=Hypsizygus marmoreus TaxID=39966 RepID=A0A369J6Q3_HYPMA|nr:putative sterigmatocystin biosynthesis peroxidase stcC [Hypsizygus marmoreus]
MYDLPTVVAFVVTNATRLVVLYWDIALTLVNWIAPNKRSHVVQTGNPGKRWGEYIAPQDGDSRSACPALNAMANHGILPRDGRNIKFTELSRTVRETYNIAETFSFVVSNFSAGMLGKAFEGGACDLADLNLHNGIEHDASLTRQDAFNQRDQGKPDAELVEELLNSATGSGRGGKPKLTIENLSWYMANRRTDAKASNPQYSLSFPHRLFGFVNTSFLLTVFDGDVGNLHDFLLEERLPEAWEPACRERMGVSLLKIAGKGIKVEIGAMFGP